MRRFSVIFLLAFLPPTAVMTMFALRSAGPSLADGGRPVVSTAADGLPPRGMTEARGVGILVYESGRLVTEIRGGEANFEGRERGLIRDARIMAWPEPGLHEEQPDEVMVTADEAEVDRQGHTARVRGHVEIVTSDGDRLQADELRITLARVVEGPDGGRTLDRSHRTIESDGRVSIRRGASHITGTGFHGHLGLRKFRFERDVDGEFFGTRESFLATGSGGGSGLPEDVKFTAGGPLVFEPIDPVEGWRRERLSAGGGVRALRIDPRTERPATLSCRELVLEFRRPPESGLAPEDPRARPELEKMAALGGVTIEDAKFLVVADGVTTESRPGGAAVTRIQGATKSVRVTGGAGMPLGKTAGGGADNRDPVDVTAVDDILISRAADGADGAPGDVTLGLSRWVWIRQGESEMTADRVDLALAPGAPQGTARPSLEPRTLAASGNVALHQPDRSARADSLTWNAGDGRIKLTGDTGAEVESGTTRLRARTISFNEKDGTLQARGAVRLQGEGGGFAPGSLFSTSPSGTAPESSAWTLTCEALDAAMGEDSLRDARASDQVTIETADSRTEADLIVLRDGLAHLTGAPVRITSGTTSADADDVHVDTARGTACLRGVRRMQVMIRGGIEGMVGLPTSATSPAERPLHVTCRGPVYLDKARGSFTARDGVTVRADADDGRPSRLDAERLFLTLDPATRELSSALATGRVLLRSGDLRAAGDRFTYDVAAGTAHFTGIGQPIFAQGAQRMRCEELVIADGGRTIKFLARHSKGSISFPDRTKDTVRPGDLLKDPFRGAEPPRKEKR